MENEVTFRTAVGGYKKDEVLEYIENMNDEIFRMKQEHEAETAGYQAKIQELEALLKQEEVNSAQLMEEQKKKLQDTEEAENKWKEDLHEAEEKWRSAYNDYIKADGEKRAIKDKLAREILRLRGENQMLRERWKEAERNVGSRSDYEAIRDTVSEVQYKIAEYVNIINKTQQSLAETYQNMNGIKKKIAEEIEKI